MMEITSLQNTRVKLAVHLRERRQREKNQLFLIEGYRELLRAVDAKVKIETIFTCPSLFLGSNEHKLIEAVVEQGGQVLQCTEEVFRKIAYRDRPDGLLAIAPLMRQTLQDLKTKENPLYVVAESIEKPGNLGTILRSSDAVGADACIVCDRCTDIHNPNVVRASVGTLFTLPVLEAKGEETFHWLKEHNVKILAATPFAKVEYTEVNLRGPIAILLGTEQLGLSEMWMKGADLQVRIPMNGVADSLNVATATTVLLYEVLRQRKNL